MAMFTGMRSLILSIPKTPSSPSPFFFTCFRFFSPSTPPSPPIFQFLETECDFPPPQISKIISTYKSLSRVKSTKTARQAVEFLRECGFTDSQLHNAILHCPTLLTLKVDCRLKPMFDFFTEFGFPNQDLINLISKEPRMLGSNLNRGIKPRIPFLEKLFGSKATLIKGIKRAPQLLLASVEKHLKPKVDVFKKWGIEGELLSLLLSINPNAFVRVSIELLETRIEYARNILRDVEGSKKFVYVVCVLVGMGPQNFEKKVKHLESLGLRKEEVQQLLMKQPIVFSLSTDKMQRNMDFLTLTAGFQPNVVLYNSCLLSYSVENRLNPRLAVFQVLCAMKQPTRNLSRMLSLTEKEFLHKVVECSPHAEILKEIYKRKVKSTDVQTTLSHL